MSETLLIIEESMITGDLINIMNSTDILEAPNSIILLSDLRYHLRQPLDPPYLWLGHRMTTEGLSALIHHVFRNF